MRKIKIFTVIDRYNIFLDIWLNYYTKFIEQNDITIVYRNMTGFNIEEYLKTKNFSKINIEIIEKNVNYCSYDYNKKQQELLKNCDVVIYADHDEIIFHENLLEILNNFSLPYITLNGFEIVHNFRIEKDFNPNEKILKQRSFGVYSPKYYDKPLILRQPLLWKSTGKHEKYIIKNKIDGLYLVHLRLFDFNTTLQINNQNSQLYINHQGIQNKIELINYYEKYFFPILVKIPDIIKMKLEI